MDGFKNRDEARSSGAQPVSESLSPRSLLAHRGAVRSERCIRWPLPSRADRVRHAVVPPRHSPSVSTASAHSAGTACSCVELGHDLLPVGPSGSSQNGEHHERREHPATGSRTGVARRDAGRERVHRRATPFEVQCPGGGAKLAVRFCFERLLGEIVVADQEWSEDCDCQRRPSCSQSPNPTDSMVLRYNQPSTVPCPPISID